ncbi:hypothetical protein [Nocardiopsis halotolerans]|uniref:hypothetical protein n=1 Tax=Nocardiopsis halotolerans TaxID=124252 RepID=UPI000344C73A|nr:hypothetical protein [Nocardiopsis halotolerans]
MPEPDTLAIASAVAANSVTRITESATDDTTTTFRSLCRAVFARFRTDSEAQAALDEARLEPNDPHALTIVAEHLERAEEEDSGIRELMEGLRGEVAQGGGSIVVNRIAGNVGGDARVYQGRDFHGDLHL